DDVGPVGSRQGLLVVVGHQPSNTASKPANARQKLSSSTLSHQVMKYVSGPNSPRPRSTPLASGNGSAAAATTAVALSEDLSSVHHLQSPAPALSTPVSYVQKPPFDARCGLLHCRKLLSHPLPTTLSSCGEQIPSRFAFGQTSRKRSNVWLRPTSAHCPRISS